jgi:DNA-binding CsgD family transcriptional regulator
MFLSDPSKREKNSNPSIILTRRQHECLQYIADGHTGRSIAHRLGISERMVRFHLEGARLRLNASSTTQAVYLAAKSGIID